MPAYGAHLRQELAGVAVLMGQSCVELLGRELDRVAAVLGWWPIHMVDERADFCTRVAAAVSVEERAKAYENQDSGHGDNGNGHHKQPDHPQTARSLVPDGLPGNGHRGIVESRLCTFTH
jgi:hypothetical protein